MQIWGYYAQSQTMDGICMPYKLSNSTTLDISRWYLWSSWTGRFVIRFQIMGNTRMYRYSTIVPISDLCTVMWNFLGLNVSSTNTLLWTKIRPVYRTYKLQFMAHWFQLWRWCSLQDICNVKYDQIHNIYSHTMMQNDFAYNADVILYPQQTISSYCPYQEVCLIATWHLRWSCLKELLSMCMAFPVDTFQTPDSSLRVSVMARLYLQSGEIPLGENKIESHTQKKKCHQMMHRQLQ